MKFKCPWDDSFMYWNHEGDPFDITAYRILPEVAQRRWSAWIPHEPGPCPIPGVKGGEYGIRFQDGQQQHPFKGMSPTKWKWGNDIDATINAYRILLPEGFTPHDGGNRPSGLPNRFELMLDDGSVVPMNTGAWWLWSKARGLRRIIGWREV